MEAHMTMTIPTDLRRVFEDKIRCGICNPVARFLPEDVREDRFQDALAQTWAMYDRYAARGELLDDTILSMRENIVRARILNRDSKISRGSAINCAGSGLRVRGSLSR
jgi:hypothetical protein